TSYCCRLCRTQSESDKESVDDQSSTFRHRLSSHAYRLCYCMALLRVDQPDIGSDCPVDDHGIFDSRTKAVLDRPYPIRIHDRSGGIIPATCPGRFSAFDRDLVYRGYCDVRDPGRAVDGDGVPGATRE